MFYYYIQYKTQETSHLCEMFHTQFAWQSYHQESEPLMVLVGSWDLELMHLYLKQEDCQHACVHCMMYACMCVCVFVCIVT